jgi:glycosyltransferase involved in cell wall biosynthesis
LYESVPPQNYGGTERVVSYLTEELVRQGHDVTLFASGDSRTAAELVPVCERSLRQDEKCVDAIALHVCMVEEAARRAHQFDIIHFHMDYLHFPVSRRHSYAHVTTLHGRMDIPELAVLYHEYSDIPVISISNAQQQSVPWADWRGTVYHGLPPDLYSLHASQGQYLLFLGRMSPEKGADQAIAIAQKAGLPLKMAAKVDRCDRDYFEETLAPLIREAAPLVEFVGEVGGRRKEELLGNAIALLFPIRWAEPFGLVMIEAMACGTPVIAYRCGSVPEVIDEGVTGFIVDDLAGAVEAVAMIASLSRRRCRQVFDERFLSERMAQDYVAIYDQVLAEQPQQGNAVPLAGP